MFKVEECPKHLRKDINRVCMIRILPIFVCLDEKGEIVHINMQHTAPLTRPQIITILKNLKRQVTIEYEVIKKSATEEKAQEVLKSFTEVNQCYPETLCGASEPTHDSQPNIVSEPDTQKNQCVMSEPSSRREIQRAGVNQVIELRPRIVSEPKL